MTDGKGGDEATESRWMGKKRRHPDDIDFEGDTRERLARVEAQNRHVAEKIDSLKDGQEDIIEALEDVPSKERVKAIEEDAEKNDERIDKAQAIVRAGIVLTTIAGGLSGYMVLF